MINSDYGKENNLNLKVLIALSRGNNFITKKSTQIFKENGLTDMQFAVLEVLYHKGDLKIGEIIESILSTGGNMTVVINNLEKNNYVVREKDSEDNRAYIIKITDKGKQKIKEIFPLHLKEIKRGFSNLEDTEKNQLINILKKMQGIH